MAGISHQNPNWLLQAYCQGLLLHIKSGPLSSVGFQAILHFGSKWEENTVQEGIYVFDWWGTWVPKMEDDRGSSEKGGWGVFLGWMEIQVDIHLDLALTNTTISTNEFKGLFSGWIGDRRWICHLLLLKRFGLGANHEKNAEKIKQRMCMHPAEAKKQNNKNKIINKLNKTFFF